MKTRIKVKWYLPALGYAICLQKEWGIFWITISWNYPSIMKNDSCVFIKDWLWWDYNEKRSNREIGKEIMNKCKLEWDEKD